MADSKDEMALVLANQQAETKLKETRAELVAVKKTASGLPTVVTGGISFATGVGIGVAEGLQHGGDPAKKEAQAGYAPGFAFVIGAGAAVAAGPNNPRARSAAVAVATGGATILGYQMGEKEGVQMALEGAKQRALAAQKAGGGALPAGQSPPAQAPQAPAPTVGAWKRS